MNLSPKSQRLPRTLRLRRQADFQRLREANVFAADEVLVVRAIRNELGWTRLGVSLSRQVGNAVVRNRWKRLTREAFRRQRGDLPPGLDLVVRPRRGATPSLDSIARSLRQLTRRLAKKLPGGPP